MARSARLDWFKDSGPILRIAAGIASPLST